MLNPFYILLPLLYRGGRLLELTATWWFPIKSIYTAHAHYCMSVYPLNMHVVPHSPRSKLTHVK